MTIDNLKCFILVAENLSFARAAETLYISQPAVTKQINSLEQELGVTLFIRSTRHVELTPAGMSFYKDAKDIVLKSQMAIDRVQRLNTSFASIRIGLSNPIALFYLSPILKKLSEPDFASVPLSDAAPLSFGIFYHKRNKNPALHKFLQLI